MESQELIKEAVRAGTTVALLIIMFAAGLKMAPGHLIYFRGRYILLLKSLACVVVLVPIAALAVVYVASPVRDAAVGLAIMAASPASPLMLTRISRVAGRLDYIGSLHLILALLSIVTTPLTLAVMSRMMGFEAGIGPLEIARLAFIVILLPVGLGLLVRVKYPDIGDGVAGPLTKFGDLLLLLMIFVILAFTYEYVFEMSVRSYAAMAAFVVLALAAGHFSAPDVFEERTALALESAGRNPGFALVIAQLNFPHAKPVAFLLPYLLVFLILSWAYIVMCKRAAAGRVN